MFEGETASVDVQVTPDDRRALLPKAAKSSPLQSRIPLIVATLLFALTITYGRDFLFSRFGVPFAMAATLASIVGLLLFLVVFNVFARSRSGASGPAPRGVLLKSYKVTAKPEGLEVASENVVTQFRWPAVLSLNETDSHFLIHTEAAQTVLVPKRSFASKDDASRFAIIVRARLGFD
jgi:hypothetical protein